MLGALCKVHLLKACPGLSSCFVLSLIDFLARCQYLLVICVFFLDSQSTPAFLHDYPAFDLTALPMSSGQRPNHFLLDLVGLFLMAAAAPLCFLWHFMGALKRFSVLWSVFFRL